MDETPIQKFFATKRSPSPTSCDVAWSVFQTASSEMDAFAPSPPDLRGETAGSLIQLARRVLVHGSSGSGKTHLSARLGAILGLAVVHLDDHFWQPGFSPREDEEWRNVLAKMVERDSWIIDGTYERTLDLRIPHADAIILLECHRLRCLERVLRRLWIGWMQSRRSALLGVSTPFALNLIRYVWHYPTVTRPVVVANIQRYGRGKPVVVIDGPEGVAPFLSSLRASPSAAAA